MARAKQQELTLEEKLKQALVPEDEWPYEVPGNWVWTRLGIVAKWGSGGTPSRRIPNYYIGNIPWVKTGELDNSFIFDTEEKISVEALKNSSAKLFPENTVVIAMYGATIGKAAILGIQATTNQACACGVSSLALYYKYLFYYAVSQKDNFIKMGKGGAQPNISQEIIKAHPVPLPPLSEQQRIVDCIESLFAKLDQAKEVAQNALDTFETRKAAILHKAFTGELTAKWREKNRVGMESWVKKPLSDLSYIQTGLAKGKINTRKVTVMPYLRVANVQDGYLDLREIKKIEVEEDKVKRYTLQRFDVLFTEGGDFDKLGRGAVWEGEIANCLHQNHIFAVRPNSVELSSYYLSYLSSSQYGKDYFLSCSKQTTNLASINSTQLKAFPVITPTLLEQQEIVRILDNLFKKEQKAKELCDVIDKIDLMKKAILARAFRGELGTNDPSEESAVDLLKECLGQPSN